MSILRDSHHFERDLVKSALWRGLVIIIQTLLVKISLWRSNCEDHCLKWPTPALQGPARRSCSWTYKDDANVQRLLAQGTWLFVLAIAMLPNRPKGLPLPLSLEYIVMYAYHPPPTLRLLYEMFTFSLWILDNGYWSLFFPWICACERQESQPSLLEEALWTSAVV